ncbi:hypothetical protein Gotur_035624 [Gossypium turneri]
MGKAPSVPPMGKAPLVPPMGYPPPGKGKEVEPKSETSQLQKENMKIQKDVKGKIVQMLCK